MKYITPTLETERLILKRGNIDDFKKVYEYDLTKLRNINGIFEYVLLNPKDLEGFENYADEDNVLDFIIYLKDNTPIGNITFDRYDEQNKSLEIAYNLHPKYWKNGFMYEAILKAMEYIFNNLDIDKIICSYAKENENSKRLCEKLGFQYDSTFFEHYSSIDKDVEIIKNEIVKDLFLKRSKRIS